MATSAGSLFIDIALKGLNAVQSQLTNLKNNLLKVSAAGTFGALKTGLASIGSAVGTAVSALGQLGKTLGELGKSATVPFALLSAAILKTVALADPKGF